MGTKILKYNFQYLHIYFYSIKLKVSQNILHDLFLLGKL